MRQKSSHRKSPHSLMVQGTTSDAGKSILVTAICRILARHNYSVVPFKPQNMALNSAVTAEGGEIGRAQAVQAQACFLKPSIKMNPILLKPNSDKGAQVIIEGKAVGNMDAVKYHGYKPKLMPMVTRIHDELKKAYEIVLIEGAGSPAEINLRQHDIANMGFAESVDCPVIIVADIDRGGVFAHLYGTYELLSDSEKKRIKGFVINRFRGDVKLLEPGLDWLEQKTTVPVLAVIPYVKDLHIEAEDSISQNQKNQQQSAAKSLKVVVVIYPRASNHTDFDVMRMHPQIDCELIKDTCQFNGADLIILPGSKHVRADLQWLVESGWDKIINKHLRYGGKVIGICGGFQMLGSWIHDPDAVESSAGSTRGLGLLDMQTSLKKHKTLRNVSGEIVGTGIQISGYEIHAGSSEINEAQKGIFQLFSVENPQQTFIDGVMNADKNIFGSYLHGLFDESESLKYWSSWAGLNEFIEFDYLAFREAQIDRLADEVEKVLPLSTLLKLLSLEASAENSAARVNPLKTKNKHRA